MRRVTLHRCAIDNRVGKGVRNLFRFLSRSEIIRRDVSVDHRLLAFAARPAVAVLHADHAVDSPWRGGA